MRKKPERLKLRTEELEAILERARSAPLSEEDLRTLKAALATLEFLTQELKQKRTSIERLRHLLFGPPSEKTQNVLGQRRPEEEAGAEAKAQSSGQAQERKRPGHGRNGAAAYRGAKRVALSHESLRSGDRCPESGCQGKVYKLATPGVIVRVRGKPPLQAMLYELEKLRCNLCGMVFTARAPEGIGARKYDETVASMIGCLR